MDAGEFINNAMEDLENQGAWLQPPSSPPQSLSKERRQPSITPRKFRRFFTPRSHDQLARHPSRTPLGDITEPLHHRHGVQSSPLRAHAGRGARESSPTVFTRDMKRRKLLHVSSPSIDGICGTKSPASSLFGDLETHTILEERDSSPTLRSLPPLDEAEEEPLPILRQHRPRKALKYIAECLTSDLLARCGGSTSRVRHQYSRRPVADWREETARFCSLPEDTHLCTSVESPTRTIPFCTTSCHTNSLVAVGDEEGHVRLLDSDKGARFAGVFLAFRPHTNAIIDMSFSQDDSLLATASGDQTGLVVDMTTRSTVAVLAQHTASLKQVKFQPGAASNSIIATSSRDGSVHLWDLRCTGATGPVLNVQVSLDPSAPASISRPRVPKFGCVVNSIIDAHRPFSSSRASRQMSIKETALRADVPDRFGDVSVTAISFLPEGRENFLLTASEANATIKLWDLRSLHTNKRKPALPVSYTAQPDSHNQWRHFGINSINLSGDGARLYALCRDSTVYTYSTNHLVLGHMPKLSAKPLLRRQPADVIEAPGPLYGFRHPQLHATSFYVKSAVRPARAGKAEMLAVGSCDGCAVLFPTDEKYLLRTQQATESRLPIMSSLSSTQSAAASRVTDTTPISERGTSLIRGHDREVGALSWTAAGELITVGDDFLVRCWREDDAARELRVNGEQGGQRWGCGWASMSSDYDDDEDE